MDHPKDFGDRTTLAVMVALREAGYVIAIPFGKNTRYDLVVDDGEGLSRVQCKTGRLRQGAVLFSTASTYLHHRHAPVSRRLSGRDRFLRRALRGDTRGLSHPYRRCTDEGRGGASSRAGTQRAAKANQARRRLPGRDRHGAGVVRQASTSRVFWCARILRFTRWRALSIVFVSQPRSSAISSYELPSR